MKSSYFPVLRSRQQENQVLCSFGFGSLMTPLIEIIKEKDRSNNTASCSAIYSELVGKVHSNKVILDLPTYLSLNTSTSQEVIRFFRSVIIRMNKRVEFYRSFEAMSAKVIPTLSSLTPITGETDSIKRQYENLHVQFPQIAFRLFFKGFEEAASELEEIPIRTTDIIIYDLDTIPVTNPLIKRHENHLKTKFSKNFRIILRSAINTDIQNVRLNHGDVIGEADNSITEFYRKYKFNAFGDFAGIKKDEISSGGTVSPGFIIYDPIENVYYGFKGKVKDLGEFEKTIVPEVLGSKMFKAMAESKPSYTVNNPGINTLERISRRLEPGKNQAKFKRISIEHYLHCMKILLETGQI